MFFRVSRPNYDKPHKCPGWSGPGLNSVKESYCTKGHIEFSTRWNLGKCKECKVLVMPPIVSLFDPLNLWYQIRYWFTSKSNLLEEIYNHLEYINELEEQIDFNQEYIDELETELFDLYQMKEKE